MPSKLHEKLTWLFKKRLTLGLYFLVISAGVSSFILHDDDLKMTLILGLTRLHTGLAIMAISLIQMVSIYHSALKQITYNPATLAMASAMSLTLSIALYITGISFLKIAGTDGTIELSAMLWIYFVASAVFCITIMIMLGHVALVIDELNDKIEITLK